MGQTPDDANLESFLVGLTLPGAVDEAAIVEKLQALAVGPASSGDPKAGRVFADRYRLTHELGRGGMGVVWEGEDVELGRRVAIKMLTGVAEPSSLARMRREARAVAQLAHPNVAAVYDVNVDAVPPYIVMEYVEGGDLGTWLRREPRPTWQAVLSAFEQAGQGLASAHRAGLVHRDFKPGNVILGGGRVRVVDFGLVRAGLPEHMTSPPDGLLDAHDPTLTARGVGLGTPAYMAPEQHEDGAVTPAADVFAFACSLYEGLYGERPYAAPSWLGLFEAKRDGPPTTPPNTEIASQVPARLYPIVVRGLAFDPDARWASMGAFVQALRRARERHRVRWVLGSAAVLAAAAGAWTGLASPDPPDQHCVSELEESERRWQDDQAAVLEQLGDATLELRDSVDRTLTEVGAEWGTAARDACETERDEALADKMTDCLAVVRDAAHGRLVAARASERSARHLARNLEFLPRAAECDAQTLAGLQPRPADPEVRREIERIRAWVRDEADAADYEAFEQYEQRAKATDYLPTVSAVQLAAARRAKSLGDYEVELDWCNEAFVTATAAGADWAAFRASESCGRANALLGRIDEARRWDGQLESLSGRLDVNPAEHLRRRSTLALALARAGQLDEARRLAARIDADTVRAPHHRFSVINVMADIGMIAMWLDDYDDAVDRMERGYDWLQRYYPEETERMTAFEGQLAMAYRYVERYDESEVLFQRALARGDSEAHTTRLNYSLMLGEQPARIADGFAVLAPARAQLEADDRENTVDYANVLTATGQLHVRAGEPTKAREALRAAKAIYLEYFEPEHIRLQLVEQLLTEADALP